MLNEKIKKLRKESGMSQEELAIKVHVVRQTVSKWENGLSVPDADDLILLARVLDVSIGELLGKESEETVSRENMVQELITINKELAERKERERLLSESNKVRGIILGLTFVGIIILTVFEGQILGFLGAMICFIIVLVILYRNLGLLTIITTDDYKLRPLKQTTIFNITLIVLCAIGILLIETGMMSLSAESEKYVAAFIIGIVIFFSGYISGKLPFTKHTGLRLPWTVMDEDTWNVAHQILGIIAVPVGIFYIMLIPIVEDFELLSGIVVALWLGLPSLISGIYYYRKFHRK